MKWVSRAFGALVGGQDASVVAARLARLLAQQRGPLFLAVLCMAGYSLFTAAPAWYIKDVVDTLEKGDTPTIGRFAIVGIGIVVIFALRGFFFFCQNYVMGKIGEDLITRMRGDLFGHMQKLSFSFFTTNPAGELVTRFTSDLINLQNALRIGITGPLRDIPLIFLLLGMLLYRSWALFLAALIIMPIALKLITRFAKRSKTLTTQRMTVFGEMTSLLMEAINGVRVVKAFGMERYEQDRFEKANQELHKKNLKTLRISSYSTPVLETIGAVAGGGIFLLGGYLIIHDFITTGDFASFLFLFFTLNEPIKKLNGFSLRLQEGLTAAQRIFQLMDVQPEIVDRPGAKHLNPIRHTLSIQVERFCYETNPDPVLRDVSIEVKAGQMIALVGMSGGGKTTLVNLLPRFFDLKEGKILIDGQDIQEGTISSLRRQIAIVTQEIFLFNDTVAANIAYGNIDCPRQQVVEAATAANAHDFISALPEGYDTMIGQGGMHLSGGQRQRLSIARALIKNAPILILDEATSALDSESEREVQEAIERLVINRTTIVIAHRLSTVSRADRIYVLEGGRIAEQGRHDELLRRGGAYKRLYEMQFRESNQPGKPRIPWRRWLSLRKADPEDAARPS